MDTEQLFSVVEGFCPSDCAELEIISIGGTKEELDTFSFGGPLPFPTLFTEGGSEVLGIEKRCPLCKANFYIAKNKFGDWMS